MSQEYCRAVRAVFSKRFNITETAVLVYRSILIELFPFRFSHMACHAFGTNLTSPVHAVLDTPYARKA